MSKTLINILGPGRSGTTMLDLMLGNDSNSFSLGEVHAWFRPFRKHHFKIDCNCGDNNCPYWIKIKDSKEQEFYTKAFDALKVDFLIDSSKNLPWMMDNNAWCQKNNIKTINFILYKPIKSYIYSVWKRGETMNEALYRYKLYYGRFFESGLNAFSVNFDELIKNPVETINVLIKITGQSINEDRIFFWKKEHHHLFGSGGVRHQSRSGSSSIEQESYPQEFEKKYSDFYNNVISNDKRVGIFIARLQEMDYRKTEWKPNKQTIVKPFWYYYLKMKNRVANIFPTYDSKE